MIQWQIEDFPDCMEGWINLLFDKTIAVSYMKMKEEAGGEAYIPSFCH